MRKYYFNMMALTMVAILSIGISSCSKEDNNNPLVGTKWICDDHPVAYVYSGLSGETYVHVLEFVSNNNYEGYFQSVKTGKIANKETSQYEYINDKQIEFISKDGQRTPWYFVSKTELCNNPDKSESWSVIYKKQ